MHGVGAARKWIYEQFRSYSPRLEVSYDQYRLKKDTSRGSRIIDDVDLYNVVAVLPGVTDQEERVMITAHYDSINMSRPPGAPAPQPGDAPAPAAKRDPNMPAPGVTDDGSGIACVMELARIMSQYEFDKTLVFVAFAGEEEGLLGATLYAQRAKSLNQKIEAVLNNDIIGSDIGGDGRMENRRVNIFSEDPIDSPSREIARYMREIGERYVPWMTVDPVFRADRFGRGGDHTAFNLEGFAAVRFSTPVENFANQHSATDTFANTSPKYIAQVTKVNGAVAASLAWAPKSPITSEEIERNGRKVTEPDADARQGPLCRVAQMEAGKSGSRSGGLCDHDAPQHRAVLGARNVRWQRDRIQYARRIHRRVCVRREGYRQGRQ